MSEVLNTEGQEEDLKKYEGDEGIVLRWLKETSLVENSKSQKDFERIGERIVKVYKNTAGADGSDANAKGRMFNVLWATVEVLGPSLYSRMPKVVVERTFKDSDPIGRLAAEIAERCTHYMIQSQQDRFNYAVSAAVQDRLLCGRGQVWLRYDAEFVEKLDQNGEPIIENGQAVRIPKKNTEKVIIDPLNWLDYRESLARNQYEVRWRERILHLTRAELIKEFGEEVGKAVDLDHYDGEKKENLTKDEQDFLMQAKVHLIYDGTAKDVLWISEGYKKGPLKALSDPFRLRDFWCCPIPLLATTTSDSTYPTPDYVIYEKLADELDYVTKRISSLVECIRVVGATAASLNKEIKSVLKLADGQVWPMDNWAQFAESGGFKGAVDWFPFEQVVAAIEPLMGYQQSLKAQIDEISSMPDIVRGASDPNDPVYTQQQKSHFTVVKLIKKQADVQRFCREIVSKIAEIIFEPGFFNDDTIALMCLLDQMKPKAQENFPQALALLRDDRLRTFRVDIETDSTIAVDENQNVERWMRYMQAVRELVQHIEGVAQYRPELFKPICEGALSAVRALRTGRSVEGAWEQAMQQIEDNDKAQAEAAAQQPPPPDYEMMKAQNEQAKIQATMQELPLKQQKLQMEMEDMQFKQSLEVEKLGLETQKVNSEFQLKSQELQLKAAEISGRELADQTEKELQAFKIQFDQAVEAQRLALEKYVAEGKLQESILEEKRLKQESELERMKLSIEAHKVSSDKARVESEGKSAAKQPTPTIHIHNGGGSKEVSLKRNPDGSLSGRSRHVDDDEKPKA
jgi:hypothetical protein